MEVFDALMRRCGVLDYVVCVRGFAVRFRLYHDGAWLEGSSITPVTYWGA